MSGQFFVLAQKQPCSSCNLLLRVTTCPCIFFEVTVVCQDGASRSKFHAWRPACGGGQERCAGVRRPREVVCTLPSDAHSICAPWGRWRNLIRALAVGANRPFGALPGGKSGRQAVAPVRAGLGRWLNLIRALNASVSCQSSASLACSGLQC